MSFTIVAIFVLVVLRSIFAVVATIKLNKPAAVAPTEASTDSLRAGTIRVTV